jgi:hypothetical protein
MESGINYPQPRAFAQTSRARGRNLIPYLFLSQLSPLLV